MPVNDPDIDAAFAQPSAGDPDIDAAFGVSKPSLASMVAAPLLSPIRTMAGIGENMVRGITGGVGSLLDVVTGDEPGTHSGGTWPPWSTAGKGVASVASAAGNKVSQLYDEAFGTGPAAQTIKERIPEALGATGIVAGLGGVAESRMGPNVAPPSFEDAMRDSHPLAGAAEDETARIAQMHASGTAAGLDLPQGATPARAAQASATNQPLANSLVRQELRLPDNAPLTPQLLTKARATYASPGYEAIKGIPDPIPLSEQTQATLNDVRPMVGGRIDLPQGDSITGQQAVTLSKTLRNRATQLDKAQGITASGDIPADLADAHRDAAEAIENDTQAHLQDTGRGDLAQAWDDARVYTAKTYSAQDALDGGGNVNVSKLKQQILKGKPLSGNLETLANLGARYPSAFKLTPEGAPNAPGVIRSTAAALAPAAGGLMGEVMGSGLGVPGIGSAIGAGVGRSVAGKIVPP